eukprot:CAMPEP_0180255280 /NCGR_PEP_ID=MMETSP0987-20121128/40639_1 /TAXON_ID=697907 /ORGANISM="non described non described, Strain CCMP2293" /LENGTH=698 /DNA_ID=CAMNT_0022224383 /DNA_START=65 /DNA_END=2158 /DNA_ORIENTATION=-
MSAHDTESVRSGHGRQQKGSVVDGSEVDDVRSSMGGSHLGYAGKKAPAAPAKPEAVELPQEMMLELVQAFCRDTRSDPASAAADKFRNSLITNAGDSSVRLRNSRLGMHSGVCMGKVFKTHPLATLDLQGNVMRDVGAIALIALLRGHETLRNLTLGCNDLGVESAIAFARELSSNNKLLSLDLGNEAAGASMYNNRFNAIAGVAFGHALVTNSSLTHLGLVGVGFGKNQDEQADTESQAAAAIKTALIVNSTLKVLKLGSNGLGTGGCVMALQGLSQNHSLQTLDLSYNGGGPEVGVVAGRALAANTTLTSLSLSHNRIGPGGTSSLAAAMLRNTSLQALDLAACDMRDRGAIALANALEANAGLVTCNCSSNNLTEYGGLAWADTLWTNRALQSLVLNDNPLGDEVAVNIAGVLAVNTTLQRLDLGSCKIGDEGALAIIDALESNQTLKHMRLFDNLISEMGGMLLADMLESHGSLHMLDVRSNQVAHAAMLRVQRECSRKKTAAESQEPRALSAQIKVLRRKEQKILECEFRIGRAEEARSEAERVLREETQALSEAQAESRIKVSEAQHRLSNCLQTVEEAHKGLSQKKGERDKIKADGEARLSELTEDLAKQAEDREALQGQIDEAQADLDATVADKNSRLSGLNTELSESRSAIQELERQTAEVHLKLRELEGARAGFLKKKKEEEEARVAQ